MYNKINNSNGKIINNKLKNKISLVNIYPSIITNIDSENQRKTLLLLYHFQ